MGGVDVFSSNLAQELARNGIQAKILLTSSARDFLPAHLDIEELPVKKEDSWPTRWRRMIHYLEKESPCVFIPNYEHRYSVISPALSNKIIIVGICHSDEEVYYQDLLRTGRFCNGIVAVSDAIASHLVSLNPEFTSRLKTIPYGVALPESNPLRFRAAGAPLKIVYLGRLARVQKRIFDLPEILRQLTKQNVSFDFTIIGDGFDRVELLEKCEAVVEKNPLHFLGVLRNEKALEELCKQDVILLTSDFEGMPIAILEAMGRGCIPVVTSIRSGIPEIIREGFNGFVVEVGNIDDFASRLSILQQDHLLCEKVSRNAYETVRDRFSLKRMVNDYLKLFQELQSQVDQGGFIRPKGAILPPPEMKLSWKQYIPALLRSAGFYCRTIFRHLKNAK